MDVRLQSPFLRRMPNPATVVIVVAAYILLTTGLFLAVDVINVAGSRDWLMTTRLEPPMLWFHLYQDAGPIELVVWSMISFLGVVSGVLGGSLAAQAHLTDDPAVRDQARRAASFWILWAITAFLLLIEDAGNVRHMLNRYGFMLTDMRRVHTALIELTWFAFIASFPLYAIVRHGRVVGALRSVRWYGIAGILIYGFTGAMNGLRNVKNFYTRLGEWMSEELLGGRLLVAYRWDQEEQWWYLPDLVLEEPGELIGMTLMVAAALAFARHLSVPEARTSSPEPRADSGTAHAESTGDADDAGEGPAVPAEASRAGRTADPGET